MVICNIFHCTVHVEGGNLDHSKSFVNCMKYMMDEPDPRKEFFDLINFDGAKLVQVSGDILELDRPNLTFILCTLHGGNTCFIYI